jgi:tripartite-type tricarboxylate transporter receptor subunit TctC
MSRPSIAAAVAIAVFCSTAPGFSKTDNYPNRTIRIVVPFVPGGGVDTLARMFAEKMQPKLGVTVIVENRAGASGTVGGTSVLQSPSDGYTVLFSSNTHSMAKQVMSKPPYDPLTDFMPIAPGGRSAPAGGDVSSIAAENAGRGRRGRSPESGALDGRHTLSRLAQPHRDD